MLTKGKKVRSDTFSVSCFYEIYIYQNISIAVQWVITVKKRKKYNDMGSSP